MRVCFARMTGCHYNERTREQPEIPMNKIAIAFLAAVSLASFGCKKKGGGEAMAAMTKYKGDLCACKDHDVECGKKASDAYMKSQSEAPGKAADRSAKGDKVLEKVQTEIARG